MLSQLCDTYNHTTPPDGRVRRVHLSHHVLKLDDGHKVGVSVGGQGVPLVFLHGLALNRRAYLSMLSRVAGMGFLAIAVDAAGHGDTGCLRRGNGQLGDSVQLILRVLDVLGVRQAVFAGHSMGGRMVIQLAAVAPERVLAAVLLDAAAGDQFDEMLAACRQSPRHAARAIHTLVSAESNARGIVAWGRDLRALVSIALVNSPRLVGIVRAARAMISSGDYSPMLHVMRKHRIPTMVLHGERDFIVSFNNAAHIASSCGGSLYQVRGVSHSWMIDYPLHGAAAMRRLLNGELGHALSCTAAALAIADWRDTAAWQRRLIEPHALVGELTNEPVNSMGMELPARLRIGLVRPAHRSRWVDRQGASQRIRTRRELATKDRASPQSRSTRGGQPCDNRDWRQDTRPDYEMFQRYFAAT